MLDRLNYIYPMDDERISSLARCGSTRATSRGRSANFAAVVAHKPLDPAQAHYDLARAYHLSHNDAKAQDELLAALETAPGFRPAQKLLLELNAESGTPPETVKK